jgi:hypothetical protein
VEHSAVSLLPVGFRAAWRPVSWFFGSALYGCPQRDGELVRMDLDADDMGADKAPVIGLCGVLEMHANGTCEESLDLGRRHPTHRSGTPRLAMQQG